MRLPRYLRRALRPPTLDIETALWEMVYMVANPRKAYRSIYYRHQTRNQWARDDPSFIIVEVCLIALGAIAWGVTYANSVGHFVRIILYMVFIDFFFEGAVISTVLWALARKFGRIEVEWLYSFDVHCNAFLPVWLLLHVVQWFFVGYFLKSSSWLSVVLGNVLYATAFVYYAWVTVHGYAALNLVRNVDHVLVLAFVAVVVCLVLTLIKFSIARAMVTQYFYL